MGLRPRKVFTLSVIRKSSGTLTSISNDSGIQGYSCGAYEKLDGKGESSIYLTGFVAYFLLHRMPDFRTLMDSTGLPSIAQLETCSSSLSQSFSQLALRRLNLPVPTTRGIRPSLSVHHQSNLYHSIYAKTSAFYPKAMHVRAAKGHEDSVALRIYGTPHRDSDLTCTTD